jgi:hypothetical protein
MVAKLEDQSTQNQVTECQCKEQIADILTRLEKLEREALTLEKLKEIEPATMLELDSPAKSISQTIADSLRPR